MKEALDVAITPRSFAHRKRRYSAKARLDFMEDADLTLLARDLLG
jgi:hypothetical protein